MKVTMVPVQKPEETAGFTGEDDTAVIPQTEEATAESEEALEAPEEGTESQDDEEKKDKPAKAGAAPVEEYEIFLEGEEGEPEPEFPSKAARDEAYGRMRVKEREAKAEAARLKRELEALRTPAGVPDPGPEPTSEDPDVNFDEAKLKEKVRKWDRDVAAFASQKADQAKREQAQRQEAQSIVDSFGTARTELSKRVPAYMEAEAIVASTMTPDRKELLLRYAEKPAHLVYFLGRNPERLEELAKETDPGRFVAKLAKLEAKIVMEKKKTQAPPPERSPRGSGAVNSADSTLDKLRAEAEKSNDYAKVNAYKRDKKRREEARRK